ncbi:hypothetical protein JCM1841_000290 [Sporobolomyces salmonicolor]
MKIVDRDLVRHDLESRIAFARDFLGFSKEDGEALNAAAPLVAPLVAGITDAVYVHLFEYSYSSKAFFLKRNSGFEGELASSLEAMTVDDDQIKFRKTFLSTYLKKVFGSNYEDPKTYEYMDKVAAMHTGLAGFKHREKKDPLIVDLQPMALLLGWVEDVVLKAVLELPEETLPIAVKIKTLRAFNKVVWLQNDLFNRYYAKNDDELAAATAARA